MESLTDETGARVPVQPAAKRIVSLVPSTTETLHSLGVFDRVVGVTRYCVHPPEARTRAAVVGGTKSPRLEAIRTLAPDLILANREENRREDIETLRKEFRVYVSYPRSLKDAIEEIQRLGILMGSPTKTAEVVALLGGQKRRLEKSRSTRFRYVYLIWRNPYMAVGKDTFVDGLLSVAGGVNAVGAPRGRYPEMNVSDIAQLAPDHIFLSSEPFPFVESHVTELARQLHSPHEPHIRLVDGELLSWHGARLQYGIPYLEHLIEEITVDRK